MSCCNRDNRLRIADPDDFDGVPPQRALRVINWLLIAWFVFGVCLIGGAAYFTYFGVQSEGDSR